MPAPWPLGPVTESERPAASLIHRPQIQPGVRAPRREARASTPAWTRRSPAGLRAGNVTPVNPNDEELAALRERHPWWQIWRVDRYLGGPLWCARPLGQTQPVLQAARPGRLSELREAEEAGLTATGQVVFGGGADRVRAGHARIPTPAAGQTPAPI